MAQPSPYTPGAVARDLPGREGPLAAIEERLEYVCALQRLAAQIRVDIAPRGQGKTSLLREAQRRAEARGLFTVWVTAGGRGSLIGDLAAEIGRRSERWPAGARRTLARSLHELTLTLGIPGAAQVSATLRPGGRRPGESGVGESRPGERRLGQSGLGEPEGGTRSFEKLLRATSEHAHHRHHPGVVLFIDEIQDGDQASLRTLAHAWQHLQSEPPEIPAAVFAAGLPNTPRVITSAATFSERYLYDTLGRLSPDAAAIALAGPARALGVEWEPAALDAAVAFAAGYPYSVQLVGHGAWMAAGYPDTGGRINADASRLGELEARHQLGELFRARWERATMAEQRFLAAMASIGDGPVKRAAIAEQLGVNTDDLGVARSRLIGKGLVSAAEASRGELTFTVPGFAGYIRDLTAQPPSAQREPDWFTVAGGLQSHLVTDARWPELQQHAREAWELGIDLSGLLRNAAASSPPAPSAERLVGTVRAILAQAGGIVTDVAGGIVTDMAGSGGEPRRHPSV